VLGFVCCVDDRTFQSNKISQGFMSKHKCSRIAPTEERLRNLSKPTRGCHLGGEGVPKRPFESQSVKY